MAQERAECSRRRILAGLGLPRATFYRWLRRAAVGRLADGLIVPHRQALPPTPDEVAVVCHFAEEHPTMGYKRLSWYMVARNVAYLRPYQVYGILREQGLMVQRAGSPPQSLTRPPAAKHPNEIWHVDLMYLYVRPRWYYLVDVLDAYSRFLVHWTLNTTMLTDTVTLTMQTALDQVTIRQSGEPRVVHDHGTQFLSQEWRSFVEGVGVTDILTRVAHPESNGLLERLHRTHREEGLAGDVLQDYYQACDVLAGWATYYNHERPHSALHYLCPADYYQRDPLACLADREQKLQQAVQQRASYWQTMSMLRSSSDLSCK